MPEEAVLSTPAPVTPTPEPVSAPVDAPSIAEHARQQSDETGPDDDDGPLDSVVDEDESKTRPRGSRAKSKQAAARINKLSAERNELRQRLDALEKAQKASAPPEPKPVYRLPASAPAEFSDPEPSLNDFAEADDPYGEWMLARGRWERRKERAEELATFHHANQQMVQEQASQYWKQTSTAHQQRLVEAQAANPAIAQALQSVQVQPPPLLDWAIMLDNNSVDVAVYLATHPTVLDEFVLMTAAQPVTEETVAITRRLLRQRMSAGTTGSVAPSPAVSHAPRPPNPVRTGLTRTGTEPPGEGASIADHAKHYLPKR